MTGSNGFDFLSLLRGLLGMAVVLGIAWLFSADRKRIDWKLVASGIFLQVLMALAILYVPFVGVFFEFLGRIFVRMISFTQEGVSFLLGPYASRDQGTVFLIHSLTSLIFFSALVSLLYYWGILQRIVRAFSWFLRRFMRSISGTEGLVVAGNVFLGMTEAPLMVKNYIPKMSKSEIFLVMVSGMGTIAGTVMGAYIGMLGGGDPSQQVFFAKHLLSASVMAAPAAIVLAKMFYPQTEKTSDEEVSVETKSEHKNAIEALASGTSLGVRLMVNIAGMLLVFIALVALVNYFCEGVIGRYTGLNDWIAQATGGKSEGLTIQFMFGVIMSPLMWLIGVPTDDMVTVGSLLGQKTVLNEFVAYFQMQQWKSAGVFIYEKSVLMSTYLLCGFANISSIGMLLGGLSILAPEKRSLIAGLGFKSMIAGALVSVLSAAVIGMILG
ncbi:MAG: Na+ dependent nucleoside transporter [Tannerella sp.]|jgi:CNT family concentrative nucleoside transporter|nr:Na+ dependent nucleoside transporter [Tannerella sp.]